MENLTTSALPQAGGPGETSGGVYTTVRTRGEPKVLIRSGQSLSETLRLARILRAVRAGKKRVVRMAHPLRRKRLRDRLARVADVENVLVLCLGNICRSPYGAARLEALARSGSKLNVRSAGLMGPGRPSPDNAQTAARANGLDLSEHISQLLTRELVAWADLVIVMSPDQARVLRRDFEAQEGKVVLLGDLDPETPDWREIPDPLDRSEEFFLETYARIDRCLGELFTLIQDRS